MSIDFSRFRAARRRFSARYREDVGVKAAERANGLADAIGNRMPVDTGSFKDSWNASTPASDLSWYDPKEHLNALGPPEGSRIPELPRAVPWGGELHVSANSPYGPFINSAQIGREPVEAVVLLVVQEFLSGIR